MNPRREVDGRPAAGRLRLTGSGVRVLAASVGLIVTGWVLGVIETYAVSTALLVIVCFSALRSVLWQPLLEIRRSVSPDHVSMDEPCLVRLEMTNSSHRRSPPVQVRDFVEGSGSALVAVAPLAPLESVSITYSLSTAARGRFELGPCNCSLLDPFRLVERSVAVLEPAEFVVWPKMWQVRLPDRAMSLDPGLHQPGSRSAVVASEEFSTLGEYMPGDDTRHIHWPSSARAGRLMVRRFEPPGPNNTWVLLDRLATNHESFEVAVSLTASVLQSAAMSGANFSFSLVDSDGSLTPVLGATSSSRTPPSHSPHHLIEALDHLASVQPILSQGHGHGTADPVDEQGRSDRLSMGVSALATHTGDRVVFIRSNPDRSPASALTDTLPEGIDVLVVPVAADSTSHSTDAIAAQRLIDRSIVSRVESRWIPRG